MDKDEVGEGSGAVDEADEPPLQPVMRDELLSLVPADNEVTDWPEAVDALDDEEEDELVLLSGEVEVDDPEDDEDERLLLTDEVDDDEVRDEEGEELLEEAAEDDDEVLEADALPESEGALLDDEVDALDEEDESEEEELLLANE